MKGELQHGKIRRPFSSFFAGGVHSTAQPCPEANMTHACMQGPPFVGERELYPNCPYISAQNGHDVLLIACAPSTVFSTADHIVRYPALCLSIVVPLFVVYNVHHYYYRRHVELVYYVYSKQYIYYIIRTHVYALFSPFSS